MNKINLKSKEVKLNNGRSLTRNYVSIEAGIRLYFTAAACRMCEITKGSRITFLNDGAEWRFYVDDDPDGFEATFPQKKGGAHVCNSGLVRMILSSWGFTKNKRASIKKTPQFHDSCPIYMLSLEDVSTVIR